tara:strand:- start:187 stop:543 length:357 start_codon:yes stop_codon:yes gene_type:complete
LQRQNGLITLHPVAQVPQVGVLVIEKALLGAVAAGVACSLISTPDACLSSAANTISGNNRSFNTGSSSKRSTLRSGTYARSGNTIIGPTGEAYFTHGRVFQGTDGTLCHNTRNAIICN